MKGFNILSPIYDVLVRFIFLNKVKLIQKYLCKRVLEAKNVLIIGGGNGSLLRFLRGKKLNIDYVEWSKNMIDNARKEAGEIDINFYQEDFNLWTKDKKYDYIICPFFLDLIPERQLPEMVTKIRGLLKHQGILLVGDFDPSKTNRVNKFLIKLMYSFFRIVCNIPANKWNNLFKTLEDVKFRKVEQKYMFNYFIRGVVYQKD